MNNKRLNRQLFIMILVALITLINVLPVQAAPNTPDGLPQDGLGWTWRSAQIRDNGTSYLITGQIVNNPSYTKTGTVTFEVIEIGTGSVILSLPQNFNVESNKSVTIEAEDSFDFPMANFNVRVTIVTEEETITSLRNMNENGQFVKIDEMVTDADGNYRFDNLEVGVYKVAEVVPEGWEPIGPTESGELVIDGDHKER